VISDHLRRIRALVGHELLVLPSVAVLPRDDRGRLLLVRLSDTGNWATIGGSVEPDEAPADAAVREAEEEAGVVVSLGGVLAVLGGPDFRITYPNGDQTSYVTTVYEAVVTDGTPRADGDETVDVAWWDAAALPIGEMSHFTRTLLSAVGVTG
jgi:8-oxo-dGTP pyrophosphatase MutT (NUDIX family)